MMYFHIFFAILAFLPTVLIADEGGTEQSISEVKRNDPRIPAYQFFHPKWGIEIATSLNALGGNDINAQKSNQEWKSLYSFSIQMDYQPPFAKQFGVLSIGPSLALYPLFPEGSSSFQKNFYDMWSFGAQLTYQLRLFREQPLVPIAGYSAEYLNYNINGGTKGSLFIQGPRFGVYLLLNLFDPQGASEFYANHGVLRNYLVGEFRMSAGNNTDLSIEGQSLYFGLRMEL